MKKILQDMELLETVDQCMSELMENHEFTCNHTEKVAHLARFILMRGVLLSPTTLDFLETFLPSVVDMNGEVAA